MPTISPTWRAQKRRMYLRSVGRPPMVTGPDFDRVQRKVRSFHARGMSYRQMDDQTGVPYSTICDSFKSKGMLSRTWSALDAMHFDPPADNSLIDATGTRRRLASLWCDGFPIPWLAERFPFIRRSTFQKILRGGLRRELDGQRVTYLMASRVAEVYDKLEGRRPEEFGIPARTVRYCAAFATKKGGVPRSCWDSDTIDDPDALPEWTGACGSVAGLNIHYRERILPACPACLAANADHKVSGRVKASSGKAGISAAKLKAIRELRGLSITELAGKLGVHRDTVYYWETGRSAPYSDRLDQLLHTLSCNPADIMKEEA